LLKGEHKTGKNYPMDKVRIGFVGTGKMGQCAHLKNYVNLEECSVVAIAEPRKELARRVAARYGIPKIYDTHREMLAVEKPDGIVAPQQFVYHWKIIPEILKAGIPVFIEKPLACSVRQGEAILNAVEKSGTWLMVGYHKRNDPAVIYAKEQMERWKTTGEMGGLRYVRISISGSGWIAGGFDDLIKTDEVPPAAEPEPLPSDMDEATYKQYISFINFFIHQVNLLRYLFGEPYRVTYADPQGILLAAVSESGKTGIIEMRPYSADTDWQESAFVALEKGYVNIELPAPLVINRAGTVKIFRDSIDDVPAQWIEPQMPPVHAMKQQAINFVESIQGKAKPKCAAAEALDDLKVSSEYFKTKQKG
jgi:predicted dehydrogenase